MSIRKIQDIKKPTRTKPLTKTTIEKADFFTSLKKETKTEKDINNFNIKNDRNDNVVFFKEKKIKNNKKSISFYVTCFLVLTILFGYITSTFLQKSTVVVKAKHQTFEINNQQVMASKGNETKIPFEIMSIDFENSVDINLQESSNMSIKATGEVTLYNDYTKKPLTIKSGTFISDKNGKTYSIDKTIDIPGFTVGTDMKSTPGSIVVPVTSFLPGELYNNDSTDFFINDYKKDANKYKNVYAKLKTPISGGFSGLVYIVNDSDKEILQNKIKNEFKEELVKKMNAQVPEGYILYPDSLSFVHSLDEKTLQSKSPQAEIMINGTIAAPIFKKKNIDDFLLKKLLIGKTEEQYKIIELLGVENLVFAYDSSLQSVNKEIQSINFNLNGNVEAIWHPDAEVIKSTLLGKTIPEAMFSFQSNEGIASAKVKIFPLWLKKIPLESKKVVIKIE